MNEFMEVLGRMGTVLVVGSLNIDVAFHVDVFPQPGEDKPVRESWQSVGGKALNQATSAHRAGAAVCLVGAVGDDSFGKEIMAFLANERIETACCETVPGVPTGLAFVLVESNARNTILFEPGAVRSLQWPASFAINPGDCVLSHAEVPARVLSAAYRAGRAAGALNVMNGMRPDQVKQLLPLVDLLVVNRHELEALFRRVVPLDVLLSEEFGTVAEGAGFHGVSLVVTLAEMGALWLSTNSIRSYFPAPQVEAVDTTAAGDVFIGAMIAQLAGGNSVHDALEFAVQAGALAVTRRGAARSAPYQAEIMSFLHRH